MYSVKFSRASEEQFYKLEKNIQDRIINSLERIKIRPYHFIKRKEGTSYFILRVGDYRIILDVKNDLSLILVMELGHRKNIYK